MTSLPGPKLSARLTALLDLLGPCRVLADVGTDHGLVPILAVTSGRAGRALGVDLREEPLRRAQENVSSWGVDDRVRLLQGDGLEALRGEEVDAVVLAGLGGTTLLGWCEAAPAVIERLEQLVVQPNRDLGPLRAWAYRRRLHLFGESLIFDNGRFFITCAFRPGSGDDPAYEDLGVSREHAFELGPHLLAQGAALTRRHYEEQHERLQRLAAAGGDEARVLAPAYAAGLAVLERL